MVWYKSGQTVASGTRAPMGILQRNPSHTEKCRVQWRGRRLVRGDQHQDYAHRILGSQKIEQRFAHPAEQSAADDASSNRW